MELVDRYIQAVKWSLPKNTQDEIVRELKANLLDEIEANTQGNSADEKTVTRVLERYGHPQKVAQSFAPQYPLVASEDMPLYKKVITHAMVLLFLFAVVMGSNHLIEEQSVNAFAYLYIVIRNFLDIAALILIAVTLAFYFLGKTGKLQKWRYFNWSLKNLPPLNATYIAKSDSVSEITSAAFGLLILWTSLWMSEEAASKLILELAPEMEHWRWIITIVIVMSLITATYRLFKRFWTKVSLGFYIAEYLVYIFGFLYLSTLPTLVIVTHPKAADLEPVIRAIFTYIWFGGAFVLTLICISLIRKWLKL